MNNPNSPVLPYVDLRELPLIGYCFVGFPGSGTATAMVTLAYIYSRGLDRSVVVESQDIFHIGKNNQIQTLALLSHVPFRSKRDSGKLPSLSDSIRFSYLQGLGSVDDLAERYRDADSITADLVPVVDCSRHPKINERLLSIAAGFGISRIVLTKIDLAPDIDYISTLAVQYSFSVLLSSSGERIPSDFYTVPRLA
jgi:hypothetical protein